MRTDQYDKIVEMTKVRNRVWQRAWDKEMWDIFKNAFSDKKQYSKSIEDYDKAIELYPKDAMAYNGKGLVYKKLILYDKAMKCFEKAIELNPKNEEAYNHRGTTYADLKQYDEALKCFEKAIELNPNYAAAFNNRGIIYYEKGNIEKAKEDFNNAINADSKHEKAQNNLERLKGITKREDDDWWNWWGQSLGRYCFRMLLLVVLIFSIILGVKNDLYFHKPVGYSTIMIIGIIVLILIFPQIKNMTIPSIISIDTLEQEEGIKKERRNFSRQLKLGSVKLNEKNELKDL